MSDPCYNEFWVPLDRQFDCSTAKLVISRYLCVPRLQIWCFVTPERTPRGQGLLLDQSVTLQTQKMSSTDEINMLPPLDDSSAEIVPVPDQQWGECLQLAECTGAPVSMGIAERWHELQFIEEETHDHHGMGGGAELHTISEWSHSTNVVFWLCLQQVDWEDLREE